MAGHDIGHASADAIVRHGVAQVPQGRGTFPDLTVEDNLRVGAYVRSRRSVDEDLDTWFGVFPRLAERRTQKAGSLSGGEQQMLAIARALDEPAEAAPVRRAEPRPRPAHHAGDVRGASGG